MELCEGGTLADLLGGLLAPDTGEMRIDGMVLTGAARRAWRRRVAYVQQEPVLLGTTLRENLLWADPDADAGSNQKLAHRADHRR